ncbi:hypothetical protein KIM372_00140 [Bombiscardovia nodaiensis]|uniref:NIPSNAP domain-containing protein n=1 Tax=Bombiscardovia nodaiensis TaxID=2932181 RepID=A0ABM8B5I6_9BIFI|nr:hypothetical protein KIM372_00140 [Bombiscardovia nodaiensis]
MQYELRTYTLSDEASAQTYFRVHWARHIRSLAKCGIGVDHVFLNRAACQVIAICTYPDGADIQAADEAYMRSPEFRADMEGFPMDAIVKVEPCIVESADFLR